MSNKKFKQKAKQVKVEKVVKEPSLARRRLLGSLFNNQAAFDGGRFEATWIAIILFVVSIVVALIPAMVTVSKTNGSDSLNGNLYHTDIAMTKFVEKLDEQDVDLKVVTDSTGDLIFSDETGVGNFAEHVATGTYSFLNSLAAEMVTIPYYAFIQDRPVSETTDEGIITVTKPFEYLRVYYAANNTETILDGGNLVEAGAYLARHLLNLDEEAMVNNVTSHLIIGKKSIFTRLYNPLSLKTPGEPAASFEGRTNSLTEGLNLRDFGLMTTSGATIDKTSPAYVEQVVANFSAMQDAAYKDVKTQAFWINTGVYSVIFTLIGLVMGLIIFISTRGKNNPYRDVRFIEAMRVGAWLLPTPALLTLVLGFILPASYFQMIFIMSLGMRSVWLTMRTLAPQQ